MPNTQIRGVVMDQTTEPPKDVIDLLNARETGAVGYTRPQVIHKEEEPLSYRTEREAALAEGDFNNLDNGN